MGSPRGKGRDTGFTRVCAAAEPLLTQSAPSALQVVSLGLYSHYLINPSDSLILQSRNAFPPDRLLPSQGPGQPGERGAGGGAGWARCQAQRQPQLGLPGSQARLPVCSGFRHSLIRTFLWVLHRIQLFPLPAERDVTHSSLKAPAAPGQVGFGKGIAAGILVLVAGV